MTNTEAKAILSDAFPRITWRLAGSEWWSNVLATIGGETNIVVSPPDLTVARKAWECSIRGNNVTVQLRDGETLPELVRRASAVLTERAADVAEAVR